MSTSFISCGETYAETLFRRHAITILPDPTSGTLRCLCLQHYNIASSGWTLGSGCTLCLDAYRQSILPLTACKAPLEACRCSICIRQPSSLQHLATQAVLSLRIDIESFELTRDVTYSQNRHAVDTKLVDIERLLPPTFPKALLQFRYRCCPGHPSHTLCSPTTQGLPPQRDRSILRRKRSRLCIYLKTNFGVPFVTCRYFSYKVPRTRRRREWLVINEKTAFLYSKFKIQFPFKIQNY